MVQINSLFSVSIFATLLLCASLSVAAESQALQGNLGDNPGQVDSTAIDTTTVQALPALESNDSVEVGVPLDTVIFKPGNILGDAAPVTDSTNFEKRLYQNPTAALFKSMVIPGWGQIGNRSIIKAVISVGLDAWFIGSAFYYKSQAADYLDKYDNAETISTRNAYYSLYEDRRDRRNKFTWFSVIVTFLSMFDAYVDAHLSGFPAHKPDSNLEFKIVPREAGEIKASLSLNF